MRGRADKKLQVAPFVSTDILEIIHDISSCLRWKKGDTGRALVLAAFNDPPTMNRLSPYLWRTYHWRDTSWIGHDDHKDISELLPSSWESTQRLKMRFPKAEYKTLLDIAFALGTPVAHAVSALLWLAVKDARVIRRAAPDYVPSSPYSLRRY